MTLETLETIRILAELFGFNPAIIYAIARQESIDLNGFRDYKTVEGFVEAPKILYEPHYFQEFSKNKFVKSHPHLYRKELDIKTGRYTKHGSYDLQYSKFMQAVKLNFDAAVMSCSWGVFQIMGDKWDVLKFKSVKDFKNFQNTLFGQLLCGVRYLSTHTQLQKICKKNRFSVLDFKTIAKFYNGKNYQINEYDTKIAKFVKIYESLQKPEILEYSKKIQILCNELLSSDKKLVVDGIIGDKTARAIDFMKGKINEL